MAKKLQTIINEVKASWNTENPLTLNDLLICIHNDMQTRNVKIRCAYGLFPAITAKPENAETIYSKATNTDLISRINGIQFVDNVLIVLI